MSELYKFSDVGKKFSGPGENLEIFKNINLIVEEGEALAIVGASGSGKSTLLHLMGALDTPSTGVVAFDGRDMALMSPDRKAAFRNKTLGFVFQFHHLLPEFSALENVSMPALIGGARRTAVLLEARAMLERVGFARAVLLRPRVLLADEPTGNLDEISGAQVGDLLQELNRELGMTLVVVTHNLELAARMDRGLELRAGALYEKSFA